MNEEAREQELKVLDHIRETLNVELEFIQYPGDTGEVLLQSVLAIHYVILHVFIFMVQEVF